MLIKDRNRKSNYKTGYLIILVIALFLIPIIFGNTKFNSSSLSYEASPIPNQISKDDYTPILSEEKYSLGNITVNGVDLSRLKLGFFLENDSYPLLKEDYDSGAYSISRTDFKFIETIEPAIQDNLDENIIDRNIITVKLNESLLVDYNNPQAGYLIYFPRLEPSRLYEFYVDNGTNIIKLDETDFTYDSDNFIVFYYKNYFKKGPVFNFQMYLIWEYDLTIQSWDIIQYPNQDLLINDVEQNFTVQFQYNFMLLGKKYGQTIQQNNVPADDIDVALTMNLPDKNKLEEHSLMLNDIVVSIGTHLNPDNSVDILLADHFLANNSIALLNFTSQFTIKFNNSVNKSWAIDRLVSLRNVRERIYFPSLIAGPEHIYVTDLKLYEYTIIIDQVKSTSSQFDRDVQYFYLNTSITGREGIEINLPYLIPGETCPFIIKYESDQTLRVVITDSIKMPLVGANVKLFYYGVQYGTYMSNYSVQPLNPGNSNENGAITLKDVPYGNYTIRVYYNGIFIKESMVNPENYINYIHTDYPHFPLWLLLFGLINVVIVFFGIILYIKNKKR
ncbi:MAG: carboxypeptidase-like regulatory domain-containing protein [Promethearchaeota archaeon]